MTTTANMTNMSFHGGLSTADGIIALLNDPQLEVNNHAIQTLLQVVDFFWYEISSARSRILSLTSQIAEPGAAWLLLSKLHFHLGEYEQSLECALTAGPLFNVQEGSPFVETILAHAVDKYVASKEADATVAPALEQLVERLLERCLVAGEFRQAIGTAIDAHRLDILQKTLNSVMDEELFYYAQKAALKHQSRVSYQKSVLAIIANAAASLEKPNYIFIADCLVAMGDVEGCIEMMKRLLISSDAQKGIVYQVCFNIAADASQAFKQSILESVKSVLEKDEQKDFGENVIACLSGALRTQAQLEFLYRNNSADMLVLERTKEALNPSNSMHHSVLSCSNALMHCGTTNDTFLRKNMDWLSYASNWSKFTAAASLGVIHKGQRGKGEDILKPYLPTHDGSGSPFSEGGAMFALGLMNVGNGIGEDKERFLNELNQTESEVLQHGILLGLGSVLMSSNDLGTVDVIKGILYHDNATSGEAAAIAIGLVMHGTGNVDVTTELLAYAHETQHEKTIRSIAIAISLIYAGKGEGAEGIIAQLLQESDALLRYGGIWCVATAYAGTSATNAISRLLHTAISDASDEVRRAAVQSLGIILCHESARGELPRIIELLSESFNPQVRYGAALALGYAFAGTGSKVAIQLVRPLCTDFTDYVRQGAYIALAMIMMQQNDVTCEHVSWARNTFETVVGMKHEDAMAKFGAVLAQGIIDASGRNSIISLTSAAGHVNHTAVAGVVLFSQFWYWYPMTHFLSLALTPTALIALDEEGLRIPKFNVTCNAKPSVFAPPPPVKVTTTAAPKKFVTAILSTAAKAAAKAKKAGRSANGSDMMDITAPSPQISMMEVDTTTTTMDTAVTSEETVKEPEATSFTINNLSRVTPGQLPLVTFNGKYQPLTTRQWNGDILVVKDTDPTLLVEYFEPADIKVTTTMDNEPSPPEPFECPDI